MSACCSDDMPFANPAINFPPLFLNTVAFLTHDMHLSRRQLAGYLEPRLPVKFCSFRIALVECYPSAAFAVILEVGSLRNTLKPYREASGAMHRPRFTLTLTLIFSDSLHLGLRSLTPNFLDSLGLCFKYKSTHSCQHALSPSLPQALTALYSLIFFYSSFIFEYPTLISAYELRHSASLVGESAGIRPVRYNLVLLDLLPNLLNQSNYPTPQIRPKYHHGFYVRYRRSDRSAHCSTHGRGPWRGVPHALLAHRRILS